MAVRSHWGGGGCEEEVNGSYGGAPCGEGERVAYGCLVGVRPVRGFGAALVVVYDARRLASTGSGGGALVGAVRLRCASCWRDGLRRGRRWSWCCSFDRCDHQRWLGCVARKRVLACSFLRAVLIPPGLQLHLADPQLHDQSLVFEHALVAKHAAADRCAWFRNCECLRVRRH